MRIGQGVGTGLGHGGITCVLHTQFSSFNVSSLFFFYIVSSRSSGRGTQAFGTAVSCPSLPIKYFCERFSRSNYNKKRGKSW